MGRECKTVDKVFNAGKKNEKKVTVKLFPWEETNAVGAVKAQFGL
jgi:S-adenosylmethionine synthetase